ncbi:MAG TPA: sigma 54-interacting transcriptional regulator, partial [Bryobacteraceae bacterium]|nr:sigma 54-interacting transcriptional regulator [Bryobacteraceae bacterium]
MTPAKILIVEDARITAEDLRDILTELGYTVTGIVSTGADAIREAGRVSPDLVMMDIHIKGDMDGIDAARAIRERYDIPVVYLTAHADTETLARARMAEPLGYIVKPFQETELQASIEMALYKQQQDRSSKLRTERLSAALGAVDNGVITVDAQTNVTFVNPSAESWTGWTNTDAIAQPVAGVFRVAPASIRALCLRALVEGNPVPIPEPASLTSRDEIERAIGGSVAPIRDHQGNATGAVIVFGEARDARNDAPVVSSRPKGSAGAFEMIFESPAMRRVVEFARRVAGTQVSTVLIEGESGTGKDVLARFLHHHSLRRAEPFLAINCAAIPETLLESELFGYEKGAFTDARQQKRGILEMASGGTVFLDEIGEMPLSLQAKLLRVLEEQVFRRLGGLKDTKVDLRVVTATNKDLRRGIQEGSFRLDLYYRLNVIRLTIPPLRDRPEDILPLANHFLGVFNQRFGRQVREISPHAAEALLGHDWPGNVRELRNSIERSVVLEDGPAIQAELLGLGS